MLRLTALTALIPALLATAAPAQEWSSRTLGPGSEPGTVIVEVTGRGAANDSCPAPCEVWESRLFFSLEPCSAVKNLTGPDEVDSSACASYGYLEGEMAVPAGVQFTWQFEADVNVTYSAQGIFMQASYYLQDEEGMCIPGQSCLMVNSMSPETLTVFAPVPVEATGWSALKGRYSGPDQTSTP